VHPAEEEPPPPDRVVEGLRRVDVARVDELPRADGRADVGRAVDLDEAVVGVRVTADLNPTVSQS